MPDLSVLMPDDFDLDEWLERDPIILKDGLDYAIFERIRKGVVSGHYLFQSRGRKAINQGKKFLDEIFKTEDLVLGNTDNKAARMMSRWLGFEEIDGYFYKRKNNG